VGGTQIVAQGLGFVSGILIVRMLAPGEYALYTLANTMLGTIKVLADGGISSGMMAEGGKVWRDPQALGAVIVTGMAMRRRFAVWSLAISLPVLLYLLRIHGASWMASVGLLAAVAVYFWTLLDWDIFGIGPLLHQQVGAMQKISVVQSLGRLVGLVATLVAVPRAVIAVAVAALPQFWASKRLRALSPALANLNQPVQAAVRKNVAKVVQRILPESIYYCLSSQITIWLISLFGSTAGIAQIGALGRLAQALTILSSSIAIMIVPRFARLPPERSRILRRYFQVMFGLCAVGGIIIQSVQLFPHQALWVLGRDYSGLTNEVTLLATGSVLGLLAGVSFGLGNARGWTIHPVIGITSQIIWQIVCISLLDVRSVDGVLWLGILTPSFQLILYSVNVVAFARRSCA
jgi:O-antigen/teichoic acid export membrane protein